MYCHSSTPTRACRSRLRSRVTHFAAALLIGGATAPALRAETPPDDALAADARDVLAMHCPPCHEAGFRPHTNNAAAPAALDLAAIARDPRLVRPGNPDGSPIYATLVRRLLNPTQPPGPSVEALARLRTWIERLPASAATCPAAHDISRARIEPLLARQATLLRTSAANLRVLTLAHIDMGCASTEHLAEARTATALFLAALAGSPKPPPMAPMDERGSLLALNIQALGWDSDRWRALMGAGARAASSNEPLILRADWLVVHVLRGELGARSANLKTLPAQKPRAFHDPEINAHDRAIVEAMLARVAPPEAVLHHTEVLLELAQTHLAPTGLSQIAAELGIDRTILERQFGDPANVVMGLLPRLAYGAVPRAEIEDGWLLLGRLGNVAPPLRTNVPIQFDAARPDITPDTPVEIRLYADRARYAVGDEVQLTIRTNVDCRLMVISIDVSGHGTIIFPNDFATKDLAHAHLSVALPARDAGYRFRTKEKGRERIVAMCTRAAGLIDGVTHDFERQRFQELGPYEAFVDNVLRNAQRRRAAALAAVAAAEAEERAAKEAAKPEGAKRASPEPQPAPPQPTGPAHAPLHQIWRTGIVFEVE